MESNSTLWPWSWRNLQNPDIVNNIHFYKPIDYVRLQRKRKFESDLISDDVTV